MAILPFPTLFPTTVKWGLRTNTQQFKSPITKSTQTIERVGAAWTANLSYAGLDEELLRPLIGFLAALGGTAGRFMLFDAGHPTPNGTISGAAVVSGAGQSGKTVNVSGFTGTLLVGDYIGLPVTRPDGITGTTELKMVTADVTGAGGAVAVSIAPAIRATPISGGTVTYNQATSVMRLLDDNQVNYGRGGSPIYSLNISCIESWL